MSSEMLSDPELGGDWPEGPWGYAGGSGAVKEPVPGKRVGKEFCGEMQGLVSSLIPG